MLRRLYVPILLSEPLITNFLITSNQIKFIRFIYTCRVISADSAVDFAKKNNEIPLTLIGIGTGIAPAHH
jgi:sulfite reductase alpha subunit-like flavoprotein